MNGAQASAHKPVLIINMDEASLSLRLTGNKGTVLRKQPLACDRVSLSARRSACTYMASVCTDPALNKRLPQVLVGNAHQFTKAVLAAKSDLGEKLLLWKEQSAWVNRFVMVRYIKKLCERLGSDLTDRCAFLLVDMASPHIHADVFRVARKKGLRMLLVPAGLTPWLQPLDSHVFRQFRAKLQELWLSCKSDAPDGEVSTCAWLQRVSEAVQQVVVGRSWAHAFRHAGVLGQDELSQRLLQALNWKAAPKVALSLPASGQAAAMFPRRCKANVQAWVQWKTVPVAPTALTLD